MIDGWVRDGYRGSSTEYANADIVIKDGVIVKPRFPSIIKEGGFIDGSTFVTLDYRFLQAMDEIGLYGLEKYKEKSFDAQRKTGTLKRFDRTETRTIQMHTSIHFAEYADNVSHDHFHTLRHQLAAAAFNAMMEYVYAVEADGKEI